jgi:hypothetical protein
VFDLSKLSSFCDRGHEASSQTGKALPRHHARTGTACPPAWGPATCRWQGTTPRPVATVAPHRLVFTQLLERDGPLPLARPHRASPIPRRVAARGIAKRPCFINELEKRGGRGGWRVGLWRGRLVTEIIDRRQQAVMRAGGGQARVSRRQHTVLRRRHRCAMAPGGFSRGLAIAH